MFSFFKKSSLASMFLNFCRTVTGNLKVFRETNWEVITGEHEYWSNDFNIIQKWKEKADRMKCFSLKRKFKSYLKNCLRYVWKQLLLNWTTLLHTPSRAEKLSKLVVLNCVKLKSHFILSWIFLWELESHRLHSHILKGLSLTACQDCIL